jgi:ATP phosphoribosyltransferase regulatory subunit
MYTFDKTDDKDVLFYQKREQLLSTLKHRFTTYGYKEIETSTFEPYDLYTSVTGTVPLDEMIKMIDQSGKVLVMRPDVTIPITRKVAAKYPELAGDIRYCYVTDVFRQTPGETNNKERTQAGIEYFGSSAPEADAEVLALAVHALKDLNLANFTLEIGHAGFTKELLSALNLPAQKLEQFKQLIQAKNMNGIKLFLQDFDLDPALRQALENIPLLYGEPFEVIKRAKAIAFNETMRATLNTLEKVLAVLQAYHVTDHTVIDLALINNMDYYSGIIFQGFAGNVGKPIVMGGRYDKLADQFNASIPAIGFACDVNALLESTENQQKIYRPAADMIIYYEQNRQDAALTATNKLREQGYCVLSYPKKCYNSTNAEYIISFAENENTLQKNDRILPFAGNEELLQLIRDLREVD